MSMGNAFFHHLRRAPGRIRMRKLPRAFAHFAQLRGLCTKFRDLFEQTPAIHVRIEHELRRTGVGERFRVSQLMLIGRMRQRNEHGRLACRG